MVRVLLLSTASIFAFSAAACGDAGEGGNTSTGGSMNSSSGGQTGLGGDGSGGDAPAGTGGTLEPDTYMSDDFSMSEADGIYTLVHGDVSMAVKPEHGARIISFMVAGAETLVQEGDAAEFGSTFWPSPQIWSWPPATSIAEIDPNAYSVSEETQRLILTSENNNFMGAIVTKTFGPAESDAGTLGFAVTYTIENTNAVQLTYAAWEVSRVASGVVFYPEGPGGVLEKSSLTPESIGGHAWYSYDASGLEGVPKIFADGAEGWLAWATPSENGGGSVVMKSFLDILASDFANGEAEIEIYADPSGDYMEVEQQGPAVTLQPGEVLAWRVEWYGATLPDTVSVESGSTELVSAVTTTLGNP